MHFAGVDLAWAGRNPTGIAVVDEGGVLVDICAVRTDDEVLNALRPHLRAECIVGFDAPLVVTNPTGQRPAETALNRDFRRFEAGAHPSNTGKPEFAGGPRAARLAAELKLDVDPYSPAQRRALEVYPHAATVALFRLPRTLKYKAKPGRDIERLRSELLRLMDLVETLAGARVGLRVCDHEGWTRLRRAVLTAQRKSELRRAEDPVDAVVCAYVALYAHRRPDDITIYGDAATGYIATPSLPSDVLTTRTGG
ncbi:MAG: GTP pyrophosphokinase [Mycobacterium sp.]|nr:MAG: GTP pyrophosphokinase [Mycobacterium sp.]